MEEEEKGIGTAVVIVIVIIIAAVAAIGGYYLGTRGGGYGGGGGEGGGGRGTPPSAMITLWAETPAANTVKLTIQYWGDDLALADLQINATNNTEGGLATINGTELTGVGSTLSTGETGSVTYAYPGVESGDVITVYIIHTPSKQKIFSATYVVVR